MMLLIASPVTSLLLSALVDGATRHVDTRGSVTYIVNGNVGGIVSVTLIAVGTTAAILAISMTVISPNAVRYRGTAVSTILSLLVIWWLGSSAALRRDPVDRAQLPFLVVAAITLVAVTLAPPTLRAIRALNTTRDLTAAALLLVAALEPNIGQVACRPDKCGVFGSLYAGFFPTENAAATFIVIAAPSLLAVRSLPYFVLSASLTLLTVAATGSRTSLLNMAIVLTFVVLHRNPLQTDRLKPVNFAWRATPLVLFLVSGWVFLSFSSDELTGRGYVYAAIRSTMHDYGLILGPGPATMQRLFESNVLAFDVSGEHGVVPHFLVETGLPGLLLLGLALLVIASRTDLSSGQEVTALGLLLAAAVQFVTEPGWLLAPRTLNFISLLLFIGFMRRRKQGAPY